MGKFCLKKIVFSFKMICAWRKCPPNFFLLSEGGRGYTKGFFCFSPYLYNNEQHRRVDESHFENTLFIPFGYQRLEDIGIVDISTKGYMVYS